MADKIADFLDMAHEMFKEIEKVPRWRLSMGLLFLGRGVNKAMLKLIRK